MLCSLLCLNPSCLLPGTLLASAQSAVHAAGLLLPLKKSSEAWCRYQMCPYSDNFADAEHNATFCVHVPKLYILDPWQVA